MPSWACGEFGKESVRWKHPVTLITHNQRCRMSTLELPTNEDLHVYRVTCFCTTEEEIIVVQIRESAHLQKNRRDGAIKRVAQIGTATVSTVQNEPQSANRCGQPRASRFENAITIL